MTKVNKPLHITARDDAALIKAFQAGDISVFDSLVIRHKDKVFNLCYRLLGDYQDANDFSQEVFIKAYRSLKKFKFESSFSTWIYRIALNTCKNRFRSLEFRNRKRTNRMPNPGVVDHNSRAVDVMDEIPSPLAELENKERTMIIQQAIDSLPKAKRVVVVLRDIQGLSYDEISLVTGLGLGTVKSKLARARLDLRKKLNGVI